jgi:hypothetical protein
MVFLDQVAAYRLPVEGSIRETIERAPDKR